MRALQTLTYINLAIVVVMTAAYFYQVIYTVIGLIFRKVKPQPDPATMHRFAAVVSARNEANVIGALVKSLKEQNYPTELLDVYVLADNCTDNTAQAARRAGAIVYERFDTTQVGKGYALDYLFKKISIRENRGYDAYFIFDADNVVDPNFVREMNKTYSRGYEVITCYRNSKNFGANWISAGYSIWFLREARFLNHPRMLLGNSCAVSGTGFLVSDKIIKQNGGWPFHLLTEDIQFSVNCALSGQKIGYCDHAVIYDEQPTDFRQSWDQRLRWSKGFYQIDAKYLLPLAWGAVHGKGRRMSCYDMFMTVAPGTLLTLLGIFINLYVAISCFTQPWFIAPVLLAKAFRYLLFALVNFYAGLLAYGLLTVISEWKRIREPAGKKLAYLLLFPIFMATYVPIAIVALVRKVEWKPIRHFGTGASAARVPELATESK